MRNLLVLVLGFSCCSTFLAAQTAEELVAKNIAAKGGIEKIKAAKTMRFVGKWQQGNFIAQVGQEAKAPDLIRETLTLQGMTAIQAYDGNVGWQISPFEGRKDPEMLGEEDLRNVVEDADFYGPLVDYKEKGNTVEYLGHDTVDGDDVYKLKVTLKNGDIYYYYLDPDSSLEIRTDRQQFIRGAMRETQTDLGSYKQVAGVYYPFSVESGPKGDPSQRSKVTIQKLEVNVPVDDSVFKMPSAPPVPSPQTHPEAPAPKTQKVKPPPTKPPKTPRATP
jgi:outer membrane lipoprotein-sorting protein